MSILDKKATDLCLIAVRRAPLNPIKIENSKQYACKKTQESISHVKRAKFIHLRLLDV